jgi:tetraacyldisaccharide 4'-kinase
MWPIALLWGLGAWIRNKLYDSGFLSSAEFEIPVISIGNLSMGGSGKTPHTEYFLYRFRERMKLAVLSRGYRRRTTGFRIAEPTDTYVTVGDEPRQIKSKFSEVVVAVGENRALAIPNLLARHPEVEVIILDDGFQHRSIKPALNILITPYDLPFWDDELFPVGWLREPAANHTRADLIVVSKCPADFNEAMEADLRKHFTAEKSQRIFFSTILYGNPYRLMASSQRREITPETSVLLFSGIAHGGDLKKYISEKAGEVLWLEFDDHYNYEQRDLQTLKQAYENLDVDQKMIITTEKDAVRLEPYRDFIIQENLAIYCLPLRVEFTGSNRMEFDNLVLQYIDYYNSAE